MKYNKTATNEYNFCSAFKAEELLFPGTITCNSTDNVRSYTITPDKKKIIIDALNIKKIDINSIDWIGERRTKLNSGGLLKFGYGSFIGEDR